jgi:hypothetical protein
MNSFSRMRRPIMGLVAAAVVLTTGVACQAQVDCAFKKLHLSRLQGIVTDQFGEIIPNTVVTLKRDGKRAAETRTHYGDVLLLGEFREITT